MNAKLHRFLHSHFLTSDQTCSIPGVYVLILDLLFGCLQSTPISCPESSGFLVSGATPGRLWRHRILLPQDFCGKTMETITEQPIKKIEFFRCPQSLPGVAPLTKKPEDSGYEIESTQVTRRNSISKSEMNIRISLCNVRRVNGMLDISLEIVPKVTH